MDKITFNLIAIFATLYSLFDSIEEQRRMLTVIWIALLFLEIICFVINLAKL